MRDDVLSDLWQWFCALDLQERIQAIAIEDALWIKMYIVLFRKTEKQHRTVFDLACESRAARRVRANFALARVIRMFFAAQTAKRYTIAPSTTSASSKAACTRTGGRRMARRTMPCVPWRLAEPLSRRLRDPTPRPSGPSALRAVSRATRALRAVSRATCGRT